MVINGEISWEDLDCETMFGHSIEANFIAFKIIKIKRRARVIIPLCAPTYTKERI